MKDKLKELFPHLTDADFDTYESDLYVRYSPEIAQFLKDEKMKFSRFVSQTEKDQWIDIPFMNDTFWKNKS